jgi:hypothetical protein
MKRGSDHCEALPVPRLLIIIIIIIIVSAGGGWLDVFVQVQLSLVNHQAEKLSIEQLVQDVFPSFAKKQTKNKQFNAKIIKSPEQAPVPGQRQRPGGLSTQALSASPLSLRLRPRVRGPVPSSLRASSNFSYIVAITSTQCKSSS